MAALTVIKAKAPMAAILSQSPPAGAHDGAHRGACGLILGLNQGT